MQYGKEVQREFRPRVLSLRLGAGVVEWGWSLQAKICATKKYIFCKNLFETFYVESRITSMITMQIYEPKSFSSVVPLTEKQYEEIEVRHKAFIKYMLKLSK